MPLDTSIALGVRAPQIDDPATAQTKRLTLGGLQAQAQMQQMQMDQARQAQQQQMTLADLYRGSVGADGKLDRAGFATAAAQRGLGAQLPGLQKQWAEADQAQQKLTAEQFDLAKKRLEASGAALSALLSKPDVTHDDVIASVAGMVQQGLMPQDQGAQLVRSLPGRPEALRPFLLSKGLEVMDASKRMDMLTPKVEYKQTGKQMVPVDTNAFTNPNPQPLTMTTTPGEDLSASTTRRGQDMTARTADLDRQQRVAAGATVVEKDAQGNPVLIDKTTGKSRQVIGADGKPLNLGAGQLDAKQALQLIDQAEPLLRTATGSWSGRGIDMLAGVFGAATPGSIGAAKLKALEGALVSKMPKMSGPQSDKDVAMYKQMAGAIGDPTVPYEQKAAALETVREIQERYAGMAPGSSKPPQGVPTVKPPAAPALPVGWTVTAH